MTKQVQQSQVTSVTRRLALRKLGTSGLVLVGGGFAVWQAYTALTNNDNNNEIGVCGGAGMIRRPLSRAVTVKTEDHEGPEYIKLSAVAADRLISSPPDLVEAKEELKSVLLPKHLRKSWKLLRQANWGDYEAHLKATRDLAKMSRGLSDGECRQLAQSSHRRTAVGLARTENVDLRMFTPSPPLPVEVVQASIPELFRKVLSSLPSGSKSANKDPKTAPVPECVSFFTDNALKTYVPGADDELIRDSDLDTEFNRESHHLYRIPRKRYSERVLTEYCLHALLSHSTIKAHALIMAQGICLPALARVAEIYGKENPRIISLVGKIVANLALHEETHDSLFATGWVNLLAKWKQDPNLLVTLPATKALSNMDQAFSGDVFQPGIYLMLPEDRNVRHLNELSNWGVDVVFIHGILGGVFYSWRELDKDNSRGWGTSDLISSEDYSYCWPRDWLKNMSPNIRVIGVDFDTYLSQWGNSCPSESFQTSLEDRSHDILRKLRAAGVGRRPVVFVGHSMGGLIIKRALTIAGESADEEDRHFARQCRGVVFYGTPHLGSRVAKINPYAKYVLFPSTEVQDLEAGSPQLVNLHLSFIEMVKAKNLKVISFGETVPTPYMGMDFTFVPPESSHPGIGDHYHVEMNHMNICKPGGKDSILFRKLHRLLWETLDEATPFE